MTTRGPIVAALLALVAGLALVLAFPAAPLAVATGALVGAGALLLGTAMIWPVTSAASERRAEPDDAAAPAGIDELLAAVDDPLLLVAGRVVERANEAATRLLGPHVVGEDVRLAIRNPAAAELLARGTTGGVPAAIDIAGIGDRDRYWTLTAHPLDGERRLVRLVDRTEGRAAERMRVDFVANASHELRTPLASLMGFIETLEDANGPADAPVRKRFLGIMAGEARRMQRLVDDLISLSRIEADRHRAPNDAVLLGALTREAVDVLGGDPTARSRIQVEIADDVRPVAGDRAQLSQLVHNLLGNALKYGREDRPVRISVTSQADGVARLVVADEGDGIAPEHLPRLTERFYRVDPGRSRAIGGTGLGLSIVKHIVERHRGRLDISSTPGIGTRVTVTLPLVRTAAGDAAAAA